MFKLRTLGTILKQSGFGPITLVFCAIFLFCSLVVWLTDPATNSFGDGLWFSFEAVSTIGFGDVIASTPAARIATVVLSFFSIFYIALITGVVVSYCTTMIKAHQEGTLSNFMSNLERLDEMTPEELAEFSRNVKKYRENREK